MVIQADSSRRQAIRNRIAAERQILFPGLVKMNRQHQRALSSASIDNKAFREAIAKMRNDVLESKAETQRVRDQLNCLIMLVKRAWSGDQAAVVHVSNIVGVSPPTFMIKSDQDDEQGEHKKAAVHHWAMLSIGLLNRHYQQLEAEGLAFARAKLQHRQEYLDQQLQCHREMLADERRRLKKRLGSAQTKGSEQLITQTHTLYKQDATTSSEKAAHTGTLVEFLYPGTRLNREQTQPKHTRLANRRFSQPGLYDSSGVVERPKRPVSAIHQHRSDSQRARPKSAVKAVNVKGDRPLKFETTRPISAKLPSTTFLTNPCTHTLYATTANNAKTKPRAKSAKAYIGIVPEPTHHHDHHYGPAPTPMGDIDGYDNREREEIHFSPFRDDVTDDLRKIELMEADFRKTATMLQQKLGISSSGAI